MNTENLKTCRYCAEQIKATARICPRCRQWLSVFSCRNPAVLVGTTSLFYFLMFAVLIEGIHKMFDPGIDFLPYRDQVSVAESNFIFGTNVLNKQLYVGIVAVVTNQSDKAWSGVELEARYFDKSGKLIDVGHGNYIWTLYPKSDGAVRVTSGNLHPLADYASYKIYVGSARDAHARF
jgi:hypothetical protein